MKFNIDREIMLKPLLLVRGVVEQRRRFPSCRTYLFRHRTAHWRSRPATRRSSSRRV